MLKIKFPDGNVKEYEQGTKIIEIAKEISPSLAKKVVAGKINGNVVDASYKVDKDSELIFITTDDDEAFGILNHSTAHVMAEAIKNLFPNAKFWVGPTIEEVIKI